MKNTGIFLLCLLFGAALLFLIQTLGNFNYSYISENDITPENEIFEVQQITYTPIFGDAIKTGGKGFNMHTITADFGVKQKLVYYKKAFIDHIFLSFLFALLPFTIILILMKKTSRIHS